MAQGLAAPVAETVVEARPTVSGGSGLRRSLSWVLPHRGGRFGALDGFRAMAAMGVVVYHLAGPIGILRPEDGTTFIEALVNNLGNFGVAVFFLLSGFLLYRPFVAAAFQDRPEPDPVRFLRHRALRIYPAYWVALLAFIVLIGVKNPSPEKYAKIALLMQNYYPAHAQVGLHVAWTLVIEVSFYVALPFIAWGIRHGLARGARSPLARLQAQLLGLGLMVVGSVLWRCTVGPQDTPFDMTHLWLFNFLDWFALGMLLAVAVAWNDMGRPLPRWFQALADNSAACWLLALQCYVVLSLLRVEAGTGAAGGARESAADLVIRFFFNGMAAFFVLLPGVLGRRRGDRLHRAFDAPAPAFVGTVSYGVYLWHTIWIKLLADAIWGTTLPKAPTLSESTVLVIGVLVATLAAATASFVLVERPLMRFKDPRPRPVSASGEAVAR